MRPRGAIASPRHKLASAPRFKAVGLPPPTMLNLPSQLSMLGNDQFGDCVTAEEFASKSAYAVQLGLPEMYWPDSACIEWARVHGALHGAMLTDIMDAVARDGIMGTDGQKYTDGSYHTVDWTHWDTLAGAIATGPIKLGVAAWALERSCTGRNGWTVLSAAWDPNVDHCVALWGYGPLEFLGSKLHAQVPAGSDPATPCVALYTWGSVGVVSHQALCAITGEAWLREPTTPEQRPVTPPGPPGPGPQPLPPGDYIVTGVLSITPK